jgi:hypothetical protein
VIAAIGAGTLATVALVLGAGIYFERARLAALVVQRYLNAYGIESDIAVSRLGWGEFLARVRAGPADAPDFTAEGMDVVLIYPGKGLVGSVTPQIVSVRLVRPVLRVSYDGEKLGFGSLQPLIDEALARDTGAPKPSVAIENGDLLLTTPYGILDVAADASIANGKLVRLKAELKPGRLKSPSFSAEFGGGTVSADFTGDKLTASVQAKANAVAFGGSSARGVELSSEIRGLEWKADGAYGFKLVSLAVTLSAAGAETPEISAGVSATRIALQSIEGRFADGRLEARARGEVATELADFRVGDTSFASLKAQNIFSSLTFEGSRDQWSATGDVHTVMDGTDARSGGVTLANFETDVAGTGTVKPDGASGTMRGTVLASGGLPRGIALRSAKLDFDGSGEAAMSGVSGTVKVSLTANGNVPRAAALDLAQRVPGVGSDEAIAAAIVRALQSATVAVRDATIVRSDEALTVSSRAPITVDGAGGARLVLGPRGGRPISETRDGETSGAVDLDLRGGGLPELRLALASYRYRQGDTLLADADTKFETALDYGSFKGLRLSGAGKLEIRGEKTQFSAPDCADASLASYRPGDSDRLRDVKARLCGTRLEIAGGAFELDLPGCARLSLASLLNNGGAMLSDVKGELCARTSAPLFAVAKGGWRLEGDWRGTSVQAAQLEAAIGDASGRIALEGKDGEIKTGALDVTAARISDLAPEPRFRPLSASGAMKAAGPDWKGEVTLSSANRRIATVALRHSLDTAEGEAAVDARGLDFAPNALQPAALVPFLSTFGTRVRGRTDFTARIAWGKDGIASNGRVTLAGVDLQSSAGMVRQVKGDIAFSSLIPIALQPNQTITMDRVELFMPLTNVSATFSYRPEAFHLASAAADVAGGKAALDALDYAFAPGSITKGTLRLTNVDVTPLIAAAGLADKVSTSARIDGVVPFTVGPEGVRFQNGRIAASGPGRLSVKREALTSSVGVAGTTVAPPNAVQDFAYQALENLAFDQLDGTVDSKPMGRLGVLLHVKGRNDPAQVAETRVGVVDLIRGQAFDKPLPLPKGTPIDLTLDTSLNLDELLNSYFNGAGPAGEDAGN